MEKAFDAVLQMEIDASVIAKTSYLLYGDRFRYQCLCCGEEVYLAAADSSVRSPHFKHRRGNNDIKCEQYLGQPGAVEHYVSIRKRNRELVEFVFNIDRMTFEICLSLTVEEISEYEQNKAKMLLYAKNNSRPFLTVPINRNVIIPNARNYFTVKEYSHDYYISFDNNNIRLEYLDVIKKSGKLNIYRVNIQDEHYKRQASSILYTDNDYVAISENEYNIQELTLLQNIETNGDVFSFITEYALFYAVRFRIKNIDYVVRSYFQKHDFQIETSESFDILWPPVFTRDSVMVCSSEEVYVSSSFELIPHGNINIDGVYIGKMDEGVHKLMVDDEVIIYEKNVDIPIIKETRKTIESSLVESTIIYTEKYIVPNDYDYYLFDKNGCIKLTADSKVYLLQDDKIIGYKNGHIKAYIYGCLEKKVSTESIINDILKYHPQSEVFIPDDFMDIEANETIIAYLEKCYRSGKINSIVKRYIMEKKI